MREKESVVSVITLDGPSGTGKGTLCHRLAEALGWHVLDSGVLYRALGFLAEKRGLALDALNALVDLAHALPIVFDKQGILLDGVRVGHELRTEACGARASQLAALPEIRAALLERQRAFAQLPGLVTDGRDKGTVVFPRAALKIYLDASSEERAQRRYLQLKETGKDVSLAQVIDELAKRDARDMAREHAPLMAANDAVVVDTTNRRVEEVFDHLLLLVCERGLMSL